MAPTASREVDFLIIGAAKCATTWLQYSLQASPGIWMPEPELHFFSREYQRGQGWYERQFANAPAHAIIGEKSNSYLTEPDAAQRIKDTYPNVKLIVQLRDPVKRAYSDYCMLYRRGEVSGDIERYLDPDRAASERFLDDGRYAHHLKRFYKTFAKEQILLLAYEDVATQPVEQLERLAAHVGYKGPLSPPLSQKVKDKDAAFVPPWLSKLLKPLRPLIDPIRHTAPISVLRDSVAQPIKYPILSAKMEAKMASYYSQDIDEMLAYAPRLGSVWTTIS